MASTMDTTSATPSAAATFQEVRPALSIYTPTIMGLSVHGPAPSAPAPATADSSLPEETLALHTAAIAKRLQ